MSKLNKATKCLWIHNAKARFETLKIQFVNYLPLYWIYRGNHGLKSERSHAFFGFLKMSYPPTDKFNIPTNYIISFPALGGTGVLISGVVYPIINSVMFSFWMIVLQEYVLPCSRSYSPRAILMFAFPNILWRIVTFRVSISPSSVAWTLTMLDK